MPAFEYTAIEQGGREVTGLLEADNERQARQRLREKQLLPLSVRSVAVETRKISGFTIRSIIPGNKVSPADLALMTRQLATLTRAGLPLEEALASVAQQSEKTRIRSVVTAVRTRLVEGYDFARCLAEFPQTFDPIFRATIAAGERSGRLDMVLERLADYTESRERLRQKIKVAMLYPSILTVMAIFVTFALMVYVVPEVVQVFAGIGQELPLLTRFVIGISEFFQSYALLFFLVLVLTILLLQRLLKKPAWQRIWHRYWLNIPYVGRLSRSLQTARFTRTLAILGASGVNILESLSVAEQVISNSAMRDSVKEASQRVREGVGLGVALGDGGYFPAMSIHLIRSGEASGQLDEMMERAALNQEQEIETRTAMIMGVFEPALIILMAIIVLVIVVAILLPIFELNQLVS